MGFVNLTIRIYWKDVLPWPWNSEELIPQTNRKSIHIPYSWLVLCPPSEVVMQFINRVWEKCMREDWMFLDNGVGIWGKTKSRLDQEEPGMSYCDFLMFVHQRTREGYWTLIWQEILIGFTNQWGGHTPMTTLILIAPSSNWWGHHPFTVKITGSSPVGVTDSLIWIEICGGVKRIGTPEIWMFKNHLRLITSR